MGRFLASLFLILGMASNGLCQVYSGSMTGVVTDPSQAALPGGGVSLADVDRGYQYAGTTDSSGRYLFRNLMPGTYRLTVKTPGFSEYIRDQIVLGVDQNASADVRLQLDTIASKVEVVSETPLLATEDAAMGRTINRTFINDLPLVGRNVLNLTYLAPGVTPAAGATYTTSGDVNFVSNGERNSTAAIITDGVTTTAPDPNTGIVRALNTPSVDAVQEYKIEQANFRADIGFAGNTVINLVTRSGTNQFHGTVYEFLQNSALNANNWFNDRNGVSTPPSASNTFGGVFGGPIKKDRTFFFIVYNGGRSRSAQTNAAGVPSAAERTGNFGELCAAGFNSGGMCANSNQQLWDPYTAQYDATRAGPVRTTYIPFNNLGTYRSPGRLRALVPRLLCRPRRVI